MEPLLSVDEAAALLGDTREWLGVPGPSDDPGTAWAPGSSSWVG